MSANGDGEPADADSPVQTPITRRSCVERGGVLGPSYSSFMAFQILTESVPACEPEVRPCLASYEATDVA